jgi:hypothetical protein
VITRQLVFGVLIVIATAGLGGYYAWRQWQQLRRLRAESMTPVDDQQYLRSQAWRRLAGALLMLVFSGMFIGWLWLDVPLTEIVEQGQEARANNEPQPQLDPSQKDVVRFSLAYVIVLLLLVLGFLGIAGYEIYAIRLYSMRQLRRIQDERRAMIASETARMRRERNGHA